MSKFKNHDHFFGEMGERHIETSYRFSDGRTVSVEEMYQHFKARMIEELHVDTNFGLIDFEDR